MAEETNNTEVVENGTVDTPETTTEESKTFTQKELDDIVEARVARAVKKAQKYAEEQIQKAQSEGERLAKLSKDERNKEEQAKRLSELEKREHDLAMKELRIEARSLLSEEGLPAEFLDIVMADTAESVKDNISNLRTVFDEAVEKRVDERLTQSRVKTGSTAGAMSKQDIMAISDTNERQRLIAENMHLFKKG
ncbi:DUF4355 domain-containing protein [Streptococcus thoraltensis]|uniref:DUF4355 domain-containing protein n=1 Tax=Streptococcus thoraltensis TaxID=55085 RepID=UPI000367EF29|nr:DUF4355 domain-containing protein [Streptococcus thoraltensis]QBX31114.1 capsid and scaffold protein [Streptococcus phage Javan616]